METSSESMEIDDIAVDKEHEEPESLKKLTKLEKLQIEGTDIDNGLEYLSESLERIVHWGVYDHEESFGVKKIEEVLEDYKEGEDQD